MVHTAVAAAMSASCWMSCDWDSGALKPTCGPSGSSTIEPSGTLGKLKFEKIFC